MSSSYYYTQYMCRVLESHESSFSQYMCKCVRSMCSCVNCMGMHACVSSGLWKAIRTRVEILLLCFMVD